MTSPWGTGPKGTATRLHSQLVRARTDGRCERCGRDGVRLECAHIVSRRYAATRTDENNGWCLCSACHRRLTEHPDEHVAFAVQTRGTDGYRALLDKAYAGAKVDWVEEAARLKALHVEVGL